MSYAHADNDANFQFVDRFHEGFEKFLMPWLKRDFSDVDWDGAFLDSRQLAANGSLRAELENALRQSFALALFVGKEYASRDWCANELRLFVELSSYRKQALADRVWIFELETLDDEALERLKERLGAVGLTLDQIRVGLRDYGTDDQLPMLIENNRVTREGNKFFEILKKTFKKRVEGARVKGDRLIGGRPVGGLSRRVLIGREAGDVDKDLDALAEAVSSQGVQVNRIEWRDLAAGNPEKLLELFVRADLVVIAVAVRRGDASAPMSEFARLQLQVASDTKARTLVWLHGDETPPDLARLPRSEAARGTVDQVARRVATTLVGPSGCRVTVLVEDRADDPTAWPQLRSELVRLWPVLRPADLAQCDLDALGLAIDALAGATLDCGDGVIVFLERDAKAMKSKLSAVQKAFLGDALVLQTAFPGLIAHEQGVVPQDPIIEWPRARFVRSNSAVTLNEADLDNLRRWFNSVERVRTSRVDRLPSRADA
jgi:hypothetical protein